MVPAGGWVRTPLEHARFFQLWQRGNDRALLTFGPGGDGDTTGIFVVGGAAQSRWRGAVFFGAPLARVAVTSTTHASFLSALGKADAVAGCAYLDRLRDPHVAALAREGRVQEIAAAEGLDRERVLVLAPQALFTYPYGAEARAGSFGTMAMVPVSEYLEEHPLGRAEWIKAFGVLFGLEGRADSLFGAITARYRLAVAGVPDALPRPEVFFGSSWKGSWSVPAGNSYMATLIQDAKGNYLFAGRHAGGNIDLDLEAVLQQGGRAQRWGRILDQHAPVTKRDVAGEDGRVLGLPVFQGGGCFYANSAESDLFGQASLEPEVVLLDLIGIFHPELRGGRQPVYFKPVQ